MAALEDSDIPGTAQNTMIITQVPCIIFLPKKLNAEGKSMF